MHCCCCCCGAAVVLSYLFFWCFVLCGSVNYRRRAERERDGERGRTRVVYKEWERERGTSAISAFPAKWSKQFAIDFFCLLLLLIFFTTLTLIIQMLRTTGERRQKRQQKNNKKYAKLKLQIGEGGRAARTQRNAAQRTAAVCRQLSVGCLFLSAALLVFLFS